MLKLEPISPKNLRHLNSNWIRRRLSDAARDGIISRSLTHARKRLVLSSHEAVFSMSCRWKRAVLSAEHCCQKQANIRRRTPPSTVKEVGRRKGSCTATSCSSTIHPQYWHQIQHARTVLSSLYHQYSVLVWGGNGMLLLSYKNVTRPAWCAMYRDCKLCCIVLCEIQWHVLCRIGERRNEEEIEKDERSKNE
jgi:hypothetical protein